MGSAIRSGRRLPLSHSLSLPGKCEPPTNNAPGAARAEEARQVRPTTSISTVTMRRRERRETGRRNEASRAGRSPSMQDSRSQTDGRADGGGASEEGRHLPADATPNPQISEAPGREGGRGTLRVHNPHGNDQLIAVRERGRERERMALRRRRIRQGLQPSAVR